MIQIKKKISLPGFLLLVAIICILTYTLEMINGRFWLTDFKVYYSAARNLVAGDQVYQVCYDMGSGYYKYSPVILFFFLPLSLLSYNVAASIYFFILGFAFWYTFTLLLQIYKRYYFTHEIKHEGLLTSLSFIAILLFFAREMHLGNINIIMLLLSCLALLNFLEDRPAKGALFLGIVILTKPFYLLLLLPLILRKKWKPLGWLGLVVACGALIPFIFPGINASIKLYEGWFRTMLSHDQAFPGMGSLDYILRENFFPNLPGYSEYIIMVVACALVGLFIMMNRQWEQKNSGQSQEINLIYEWFLLIALLPLLFKNDWVQFLLTAPLIFFIIFYIAETRKFRLIPLLAVLLFFYGANSDDLLGKEVARKIVKMGFMGLSNFLLVILSLILYLDFRKPGLLKDRK